MSPCTTKLRPHAITNITTAEMMHFLVMSPSPRFRRAHASRKTPLDDHRHRALDKAFAKSSAQQIVVLKKFSDSVAVKSLTHWANGMAPKDDLLKELSWVTDKISTLLWTINLSTLGTTWTLLLGAPSVPDKLKLPSGAAIPILACCIASMVCELGQYLAAYYNNVRALRALEEIDASNFANDTKKRFFIYRYCLFFF